MKYQDCQATQYTSEEKGKSEWIIRTPDGEELHRLSPDFTEKQVMEIIHFVRKVEREGVDNGIN